MHLSEFENRPRFYVSARIEKNLQILNLTIDKFQMAQWARDLNRLVERSKIADSKTRQRLKKEVKAKQKRY